jgi:hypothetical protein
MERDLGGSPRQSDIGPGAASVNGKADRTW